jgi:hypothetical protein
MGKPTKSDSNDHNTTNNTTPKKPASSAARKTYQRGEGSTEKSKNRVAAAKPPKSPALPAHHNRVDTDAPSVCSSSQASNSSSNRPGLPLFVQKQLAIDIEEAGGINIVVVDASDNQALSQLCNRNQKLYGKRGDPIRRRIRRKIEYWKQYCIEGTYQEKVLDRLHVKSASVLKYKRDKKQGAKYNRKVSLNKPPPEEGSDSEESSGSAGDSSDSEESSSSSIGSTDSIVPRKVVFDSPPHPQSTTMSSLPSINGAAPPGAGKLLYCFLISCFLLVLTANNVSVVVEVNTERPELNGGDVLVYPTSSIPGIDGKSHYYGFSLLLQMDPRWVQDDSGVDCYTARVFTSNSVLIKMPAWPFSPLAERDQYATGFNESAVAAIDNAIHDFAANKQQRKFKYILLVFKNVGQKREILLSSKEINSDSGEDQELEPQMVRLNHRRAGGGTNEEGWGVFQVARLDIKPEKRGRLQMMQKKSKAASFFLGSSDGVLKGEHQGQEGDSHME